MRTPPPLRMRCRQPTFSPRSRSRPKRGSTRTKYGRGKPPLAATRSTCFRGFANYMLRQYQPAVVALAEAAGRAPRQRHIRQWLAATCAQLGHLESARKEAVAVLQIEPEFTIKTTATIFSPFRHVNDTEHLFEGLRKAGLPEE